MLSSAQQTALSLIEGWRKGGGRRQAEDKKQKWTKNYKRGLFYHAYHFSLPLLFDFRTMYSESLFIFLKILMQKRKHKE